MLGSDGRPVRGAKLYLRPASGVRRPQLSRAYATTEADGRFRFAVPAKDVRSQTHIAAVAPNLGAGWLSIPPGGTTHDLTLQLLGDDVPITGQIVDLEGKPVRGATLRVLQVNAAPREDMAPWLAAIKGNPVDHLRTVSDFLPEFTAAPSFEAVTDAEGRFRLAGIGRNRVVSAQLDGPTIVSEHLQILTRLGEAISLRKERQGEPAVVTTYYGSSFRHMAAPSKPIVGVVRDKATKRPLAGITIASHTFATRPNFLNDIVETVTDAEGHFRLTGMPKGKGNEIIAVPEGNRPYVVCIEEVPDTTGLDPVNVDIDLLRAVLIKGKITDKATGMPLQGRIAVEYFALASNPNLTDYEGFRGSASMHIVEANEDGSYQIAGLPGPGLLGVYYSEQDYLRANERDDEYGTSASELNTHPYAIIFSGNYRALAPIEPATGCLTVNRDITLDSGWTFTGTVIGPDGKPLSGSRSFGLRSRSWSMNAMETAEFTVRAFNPHRPRPVLFVEQKSGLMGVARPPEHPGDSIKVVMQASAGIRGRLVNASGEPRVGVELTLWFGSDRGTRSSGYSPERIKTGAEGRFHIAALPPGCEIRLTEAENEGQNEVLIGPELKPGETRDLGDVRMTVAKR